MGGEAQGRERKGKEKGDAGRGRKGAEEREKERKLCSPEPHTAASSWEQEPSALCPHQLGLDFNAGKKLPLLSIWAFNKNIKYNVAVSLALITL